MNYSETLNYIHSLLVFGSRPGLERMNEVMEKLNNIQDTLKCIHIAGTNGKGSTATMLSNVYIAAGYKVGLYISPYVITFRERIQVNGQLISEEDLCSVCEQVKNTNITLTEFEFITAAAFLYFAQQKCDVVILETGLGGRLDATNIIKNPLCSVITHIALDHMQVLGDTIEKIAGEKCGIIKGGAPVVTDCMQDPAALSVIKSYSQHLTVPDKNDLVILNSDITGNTFIYKGDTYKTTLIGKHQVNNALSVIETVKAAALPVSGSAIKKGIEATRFAARLEVISSNPLVVLDGAHNPDGAKALENFMKNYSGSITAIIGMMADKSCDEALSIALPHCKNVITVTVKENPRAISASELCSISEKYCSNCLSAENYDEAIKKAKELCGDNPLFIFGSLYLASAIRPKLI